MKTNTKEVKQAIQAFIMDNIDLSGYGMANTATNLYSVFKDEYGFEINRSGEQNAFCEWLAGLPSSINIPYYDEDILEQMEAFGLHNDKGYTPLQTWNLFRKLIYRELHTLVRSEKNERKSFADGVLKSIA